MNARKHPPGLDIRIEEPVGRMGAVGTRERSIDELVHGESVVKKTGLVPQPVELPRSAFVFPTGCVPFEVLERRQLDVERYASPVELLDLHAKGFMGSV